MHRQELRDKQQEGVEPLISRRKNVRGVPADQRTVNGSRFGNTGARIRIVAYMRFKRRLLSSLDSYRSKRGVFAASADGKGRLLARLWAAPNRMPSCWLSRCHARPPFCAAANVSKRDKGPASSKARARAAWRREARSHSDKPPPSLRGTGVLFQEEQSP